MAPRREPHPTPHDHKSHTGLPASPDSDRHTEEDKHHPLDHPHPHPDHHPQKKPSLPPRHNPHTQPPERVLDVDHGTHEDRPRPAKIMMKEGKTGTKTPRK